MNASVVVLAFVLFLIAFRQVGNLRLQIWQIMLFGALVVLITGQIGLEAAYKAINFDVLLFLLGMFVVGEALEESGYLSHMSYKIFRRAKSADSLLLYVLFGSGIASAFLMNDTLAIIGTPVILMLAEKHDMNPKVLLLALCFSVTIGSVMSPIGNPQNLLIALSGGIINPFIKFLTFLFIPTMINLFATYLLLKIYYREHFHDDELNHSDEPIRDKKLAALCKISLLIILLLVSAKIMLVFLNVGFELHLTYIALAAAFPIIALSERRLKIMKKIDWHTLIFFAAMFVLMESVWDSGFFQSMISESGLDLTTTPAILIISVLLSQLISNVPLVMLYLPILMHAGVSEAGLIALAAGSTIAGNFTILGAASNVIIIQNAEKRSDETITFWDFMKIGIPLTAINVLIYSLFLGLG